MDTTQSRRRKAMRNILMSFVVAACSQAGSSYASTASLNPQPLPPRTATGEVSETKQDKAAIIIVSGKPAPAAVAVKKARKWKPVPAPVATPAPAKVIPKTP